MLLIPSPWAQERAFLLGVAIPVSLLADSSGFPFLLLSAPIPP